MIELQCADVLEWARNYQGEPFHALLADAPYELNFMSKGWDNSGISFRPETWAALAAHLHDGAFLMVFGGSRTAHRIAVALEDAGLIMHPQISWLYASGFPKATRIKGDARFNGHRYGLQAIKPASEPILIAQKPYRGKPVECITRTGAGALWIDGGRIDTSNAPVDGGRDFDAVPLVAMAREGWGIYGAQTTRAYHPHIQGRWPANVILSHSPDCVRTGEKRVKSNGNFPMQQNTTSWKMASRGKALTPEADYADADGLETVEAWRCSEFCAVAALDKQSGLLTSGKVLPHHQSRESENRAMGGKNYARTGIETYGDTGGASRFFTTVSYALDESDPFVYQAKASRRERDAGLEGMLPRQGFDKNTSKQIAHVNHSTGETTYNEYKPSQYRNSHPTVKPIALARHLATLLLPPAEYAPRRILNPFSGSGSECIGAMLAGWEEIVGVEFMPEYVEIGRARIAHWQQRQLSMELA